MGKRKGLRRHKRIQTRNNHRIDLDLMYEGIDTVVRSSINDHDIENKYDSPLALRSVGSPLSTPKGTFTTFQNIFNTPVSTQNYVCITPVNKSKGLRMKNLDSFNCTNLNYLFNNDSPLDNVIYNDLTKSPLICKDKLSGSYSSPNLLGQVYTPPLLINKRRSMSCLGKTNSPYFLTREVNKRNNNFKDSINESCNNLEQLLDKSNAVSSKNICETPKVCQADKLNLLTDNNVDDKLIYKTPYKIANDVLQTPKYSSADTKLNKILNNLQINSDKPSVRLTKLRSFTEKVLVASPIVRTPKINYKKLDNPSSTEMSFFSPNLYNMKPMSTPVDKFTKPENPLKAIASKLLQTSENMNEKPAKYGEINRSFVYDATTPKCNEKKELINKQNELTKSRGSFIEKQINLSKIRNMKMNAKKKCSCLEPSSDEIQAKPSKIESTPKLIKSPMKHKILEKSENILNISNQIKQAGLMRRIKKFHVRYTSKWTARILEICNWLGLSVRQGLSALYNKNNNESQVSSIEQKNDDCRCELYRNRIELIALELQNAKTELSTVKMELLDTKSNFFQLKNKQDELENKYTTIIQEIENMKKEFKTFNMPRPIIPAPPPMMAGPPPPPPPPPPLPLITIPNNISMRGKTNNKKSHEKKVNENSRPHISLEDILKVKLRKTTDKPPAVRRNAQPLISREMLCQIKLRPTTVSRPQTPTSFKDMSSTSTTSLAASPHTSLTRILSSVDTNEGADT